MVAASFFRSVYEEDLVLVTFSKISRFIVNQPDYSPSISMCELPLATHSLT